MLHHVKLITLLAIVMLLIDAVWLGVVAKNIYIKEIGSLMNIHNGSLQPNIMAAVAAYAFLVLGLYTFCFLNTEFPESTMLRGALFGLACYGVYNFTNAAIMPYWSLKISIIDTTWGATLCALSAFLVKKFVA